MKRVCIATHGEFASGIISAASIIAGKKANVDFLNAYVGEVSFPSQLESYFDRCTDSDEIYFLTDMFGGSVNQAVMKYLSQYPNLYIITGINLPLILEFVLSENWNEEALRQMVEQAKTAVIYVNDVLKAESKDDFDF